MPLNHTTRSGRWLLVPLVLGALAFTFTAGACGDDDENCAYIFTSVPTLADCETLQDELGCANLTYIADDQQCNLNTCASCVDADDDWDGDLDWDGDIDLDE